MIDFEQLQCDCLELCDKAYDDAYEFDEEEKYKYSLLGPGEQIFAIMVGWAE